MLNQAWYWNGPQLKSTVWMAIKLSFRIHTKKEGRGTVARGHKCSEFRAGIGLDFQFWILVHPNNDIWAIECQIWILRLNVFELSNVNFEFWGWMCTSKQTSCYGFYIVVVNIAYTFLSVLHYKVCCGVGHLGWNIPALLCSTTPCIPQRLVPHLIINRDKNLIAKQ